MGKEMVIVGNDTLKELGISPNQQLNKLANDYHYVPNLAYMDEKDADLNRLEVSNQVIRPDHSLNLSYVFTAAQPNYRFPADRHEIRAAGSLRLDENWRAFGEIAYDIETAALISDGIGIAYDNECFSFAVNYSETRPQFTGDSTSQSIGFRLGLRTIGGDGYTHKFNEDEQ